jgi:glycosyltransferase involved in cell wall biosynthesis
METDPQSATEDLTRRLAAVEEQIAALRELSVRTYEDTPRATATVLSARRDPAYGDAYAAEPLVTARMGAYRGGDILFDRALASIRTQTYSNWEAVIVCDGRDEETAARIAALDEARIRCVGRPRNGPYPDESFKRWQVAGTHPFNLAVSLARGAWIAPIDQDDEWAPDHLEALLAAAMASGAEVVYGVSRVDLGDGSETWFGSWPPKLGDFGFQSAIYHAGLAPLLYDANSWLVGEPADWNLARRMLEAGVSFEFLEHVVTSYYVTPEESSWGGWKAREQEQGPFRRDGG